MGPYLKLMTGAPPCRFWYHFCNFRSSLHICLGGSVEMVFFLCDFRLVTWRCLYMNDAINRACFSMCFVKIVRKY